MVYHSQWSLRWVDFRISRSSSMCRRVLSILDYQIWFAAKRVGMLSTLSPADGCLQKPERSFCFYDAIATLSRAIFYVIGKRLRISRRSRAWRHIHQHRQINFNIIYLTRENCKNYYHNSGPKKKIDPYIIIFLKVWTECECYMWYESAHGSS